MRIHGRTKYFDVVTVTWKAATLYSNIDPSVNAAYEIGTSRDLSARLRSGAMTAPITQPRWNPTPGSRSGTPEQAGETHTCRARRSQIEGPSAKASAKMCSSRSTADSSGQLSSTKSIPVRRAGCYAVGSVPATASPSAAAGRSAIADRAGHGRRARDGRRTTTRVHPGATTRTRRRSLRSGPRGRRRQRALRWRPSAGV